MIPKTKLVATLAACLLAGCATGPTTTPSGGHLGAAKAPPVADARIPEPVRISPVLPPPRPEVKAETYSVVVNNVLVHDLLFALARDAKINVDVHPGIRGTVTLNAIDQTLPQLLNRIAKQVDMRYELDGPNLVVMPDTPFLRTYKVDYVNLSRDVTGTVAINTQITTTGAASAGGMSSASGAGAMGANNSSVTEVKNTARNHFWESLEKNVKDILRETDKILPEGSSETVVENTGQPGAPAANANARTRAASAAGTAGGGGAQGGDGVGISAAPGSGTTVVRRVTFREAASVIANAETGVVTVRATARQHEKIQEFLDQVMASARRQVLIEATIAEVSLSDNYQQGIDWQYLRNRGSQVAIGQGATTRTINPLTGAIETIVSSTLPTVLTNNLFTAAFRNGGFTAAIRLLESFGNVKVLSSPRLSVLNNQTALLKVVNNHVFFTVEATQTAVTTGGTIVPSTITAKPNTVAVGLVMSVTPQISDADSVTLNVRPTITRVTRSVEDPTPALATANIKNLVPEIQTREMESVLRVTDGEIAVLGGLMQDDIDYRTDAVPWLSRIPGVGELFKYRNDTARKTELVIFLRPVVVRDASIAGSYRDYRDQLPDQSFFRKNDPAQRALRPAPDGNKP
ncbi:MAG: pilus (MSHA type) biogenesis protein MshL [Betaproteobacteria bacterium]|nr:pilus (MSHA type) biogenesis protein MshL [Betaproteobacteria bacterium]